MLRGKPQAGCESGTGSNGTRNQLFAASHETARLPRPTLQGQRLESPSGLFQKKGFFSKQQENTVSTKQEFQLMRKRVGENASPATMTDAPGRRETGCSGRQTRLLSGSCPRSHMMCVPGRGRWAALRGCVTVLRAREGDKPLAGLSLVSRDILRLQERSSSAPRPATGTLVLPPALAALWQSGNLQLDREKRSDVRGARCSRTGRAPAQARRKRHRVREWCGERDAVIRVSGRCLSVSRGGS